MTPPRLAADLLGIDIGNNKALAVLWRDGVERGRWRFTFAGRSTAWIRAAWRAVLHDADGTAIEVASVAPLQTRLLLDAARGRRAARPRVARWDDPWPFELAVRQPHTVGVDRLANVAGLCALGLRRGVAVDAGTAITIDVLHERRFDGGLILPGFDLLLRGLHERTAQLPRVVLRGPVPLVGRDTAGALRAGAWHTLRHGVAGIVRALLEEQGPRAGVRVTGGQGEWFEELVPGRTRLVPDLTLLGLRLLAARRGRRPSA